MQRCVTAKELGAASSFTLNPPRNYRFNLFPCDANCAAAMKDVLVETDTPLPRSFQPNLGVTRGMVGYRFMMPTRYLWKLIHSA